MKYEIKSIVYKAFVALSIVIPCQATTFIFKGIKIVSTKGDITAQKVDSIVNAANEQLKAGSGVCGAIFKAAGKQKLQKACDKFQSKKNKVRCLVGQARITPSFDLKKKGIKFVVHAVGPDCRKIKNKHLVSSYLSNAYKNSLKLANSKKLKSIAFPFISSAVFACPKPFAADTAAKAIKNYISNHRTSLKEIRFVLFSDDDYKIFNKELSKVFKISKK